MAESLELLRRQHSQIWESPGWQEFRSYRDKKWDPLIRRRAPQSLNPTAADFLQATNSSVDIQSPDLEKDIHDRVAVLLANSARIDAISLDSSTKAKEAVEDIRIWSAGSWLKQNDGYQISRHVFEQMVRYGVATVRKTWHMPEEPEVESGDPKQALKEREEYFRKSDSDCFSWQPVSPLELAWFPLREPEVFIQESVVPYIEAKSLQNKDGRKLRLTRDNEIYFIGDTEPEESGGDWGLTKNIRLTTRAAINKDTGRWEVTEWVRCDGRQMTEAKQLDEYVCPFSHSPFYVIPGGDELVTETNPHLRYRPMIYPLIVDVQELNSLVTLLVMTAVWHIQNPFYVALFGVNAEVAQAIEGLAQAGYGVIEGSGAERKFLWRTPEPGTGEVMVAPRLEQMPNANLPQAFMERIQQVQANILEHKSNRYLTGEAFDQTREQPATTTLNQAEAAATPFGTYLTNSDRFTKEWLLAEHDAVQYWDEASPEGMSKPYPWRTRGDEPVAKSPREPGEVVTISADKLKYPYILQVTTRNETQAEAAFNQQLSDMAFQNKRITREQWLKGETGTGIVDVQRQIEDLWKDQMDQMAEAEFQPVLMQSYRNLFQALTGLNSALTQPAASQGAEEPAALPAGDQQQALMQEPRFGVQNGTAPVVQGPSGGSAPLGGL